MHRSAASGFTPLCLALCLVGFTGANALAWAQVAETQGGDRLQRASDLTAEAQQRGREGRYQEAIPKAREALAIWEGLLGPTHPLVIQSVQALALVSARTVIMRRRGASTSGHSPCASRRSGRITPPSPPPSAASDSSCT